MKDLLLYICTASVLAFGSATVVLATLALRAARKYVKLAEVRMELLRQGQSRLVALAAGGRLGADGTMFERELEELREARRRIPVPATAASARAGNQAPEGRDRAGGSKPVPFPDTSTSRKRASAEPAKPRLGTRHPHPDDGAAPPARRAPAPARAQSNAPVEMFRKHYDKYLENYRGYVELAERLHRPSNDGVEPSFTEKLDREERLRRVDDGIARTTARLDILEGLNPDLAVDDRVSQRAEIARRHAELT